MKRILTIQDISCLGRCSLTVALPLLSATGVEAVILPTAVLSTHTAFKGFTVKDLSDQIVPITEHWKDQGIKFDAIYTGYLGTVEEIDTVKQIFRDFGGGDTILFVDPAMADNGKLYAGFDEHYAKKNAELLDGADFAVPNITEACFMTDTEYRESYDEAYVVDLLKKLAALGTKTPVLTGISLEPGKTGVMGLDTEKDETFVYQNDQVPVMYHGTGDVFSSVAAGAITRGLAWQDAMELAADYTAETIRVTEADPDHHWYGVNFEATIPQLVRALEERLGE